MSTKAPAKGVISVSAAIGVYMLYLTVSGAGATTPAIASLAAAFPDASYTTITLINTLPSLTTILGCLIMGAVAGKKISFKTAGIISLLVYGVFGVLPAFWNDSIGAVLICRALIGFGFGFIAPLGAASFLRMIRDKDVRSTYLGRGSAVQQVGCVILTLAGGWLCAVNWTYTFLAYALCFVALIIFIPTFKEPPTVQEIIAAEGDVSADEFKKAQRVRFSVLVWFFLAIIAIGQMICSPIMMNFSSLMAEVGVGGAGTAGTLLSVFVLGGVVSNVLTDKIVKAFGKASGLFAFILAAIGALIIAFSGNVVMFAVGIFVVGVGWILVLPLITLEIGQLTSPAGLAWAVSLFFVFMNIGNFVSSYWNGLIFQVFGQNFVIPYIVAAVLFVVIGFIWLIINFGNKTWAKKESM